MKYNWSNVITAFREAIIPGITFLKEDGSEDFSRKAVFALLVRETDRFHPFGTDRELGEALQKMPARCNYRNLRSYWATKNGREFIKDSLHEMCLEVEETINDYYSDLWNFAPGVKLPHKILYPYWDKEVDKIYNKVMKAARS